jgi:PAS domain S-box-containing protein
MDIIDYKALFEQSSASVVMMDTDFTILAVSDTFTKATKTIREDIVGRNIFDVFPDNPNDSTANGENTIRASLNRVLTTKTPDRLAVVRYDIPNPESEHGEFITKYWRPRHSPVFDELNNVKYIIQQAEDVTENEALIEQLEAEKRVAKKLEDSEKRYNLMLMRSPFAFAILKGKGMVVTLANDSIKAFWKKGEQIEGKSLLEVLPEIKNTSFPELLDYVYTNGITHYGDELLAQIDSSGTLEDIYFNFVYQPYLEADETISGVTIIAYEVTAKVLVHKALAKQREAENKALKHFEESEKKFRLLTNAMPQKITNADADGNVHFFNQQWMDETGLTFEELANGGWGKSLHPEDLAITTANWKHSVATGEIFDMELRIQNKHGEYRWNLSRAVPIRDESGKIVMWVGSTTDIHEQKEQKEVLEMAVKERTKELELANKELAFQNEEKEQRAAELSLANLHLVSQNEEKEQRAAELILANKELESFTYVSSHDLQEPLNKIQIFAGRILESEHQNLTDKGKDHFRRMQDAAARMQQLIEDLLAYSNTSITERTFEKADLNVIIEEVKKQMEDTIQEKHATIEATELCEVSIIPFQFRQLMYNIISNALKFSRSDIAPHIIITSTIKKGKDLHNAELLPDKEYCHIKISDNGIGFEPQYSQKIFEVFQRLHGKEQYSGTGIGLAIVKKIVDNHNGIITATSELGSGTRFDMYLPFR